jgi:hypothetical protein
LITIKNKLTELEVRIGDEKRSETGVDWLLPTLLKKKIKHVSKD